QADDTAAANRSVSSPELSAAGGEAGAGSGADWGEAGAAGFVGVTSVDVGVPPSTATARTESPPTASSTAGGPSHPPPNRPREAGSRSVEGSPGAAGTGSGTVRPLWTIAPDGYESSTARTSVCASAEVGRLDGSAAKHRRRSRSISTGTPSGSSNRRVSSTPY